ncbi:MAG TPA: hypothetical protein P5337_13015, partial [Aestuariivirga sp.]|nr:hypothetical protein [Aestuariivirga sp.]
HGKDAGLARQLGEVRDVWWTAQRSQDLSQAVVFAGEGLDLIRDIQPAGDIVRRIAGDAEHLLRNAGSALA